MTFLDRSDAGRQLSKHLTDYANRSDVLILALPRGGVPVAYEVAIALKAPLDVFVVRKLGVPGHEELAMGAIAAPGSNGQPVQVLNQSIRQAYHISEAQLQQVIQREQSELDRREQVYRTNRPVPNVQDKTIILIDDGLATGATMRVAVQALRQQKPAQLVIAVPVASPKTCHDLQNDGNTVVCPLTLTPFYGVGQGYDNFSQTTDVEVRELLQKAASLRSANQ